MTEGVVYGLVSQDPFRMGYDGVRAAVAMVRHQGTPEREHRRGDGHQVQPEQPEGRQFVDPRCGSPNQVDIG